MYGTDRAVVYTDDYLEFYAEQFAEHMVYLHGVTLDQYLADPARYRKLLGAPYPLLDQQQAVADKYADEQMRLSETFDSTTTMRDGAVIEPMHHHRHPKRSPRAAFWRKRRA